MEFRLKYLVIYIWLWESFVMYRHIMTFNIACQARNLTKREHWEEYAQTYVHISKSILKLNELPVPQWGITHYPVYIQSTCARGGDNDIIIGTRTKYLDTQKQRLWRPIVVPTYVNVNFHFIASAEENHLRAEEWWERG